MIHFTVTDIPGYLSDEVIPNAEVWRDKLLFKDGGSFLFHHRAMLGTGRALPLCPTLLFGSAA